MRSIRYICVLLLLAATWGGGNLSGRESPLVKNPRVTTDRSVDCSTVDRILADLADEGMSDEERVLAVFHWIRRVLYHGDGPRELAFDFGRMVHSLGNGSCLRQTTPMALLLRRLGYESRSWVHNGHHMIEVRYGGAWHCLDPHMNFFVYDRSSPPGIAGVEQLRADSTLAFAAKAEDRAAPGFLLCGDTPSFFTGGGEWRLEKHWPEMTVEEPFNRLVLRRGESITWYWAPGENYWENAWQFDCGPYHTCGPADRRDTVNWPLYEPHMAVVNGIRSYRHWARGEMVYRPDLLTDHWEDAAVRSSNITVASGWGLMSEDPGRKAELVFEVGCPYVITAGSVRLETDGTREDFRVQVKRPGADTWQDVELGGEGEVLEAGFIGPVAGSFEGYLVRLEFLTRTSIRSLRIGTDFEHNPYALPYLAPGTNRVTVSAGSMGSPLEVEWRYAEGPDWNVEKVFSRTVEGPDEFTVEVAGEKYPRNLSLRLEVEP